MGDFNLDQAIAILPLVKTIAAEIIDRRTERRQLTRLRDALEVENSPEGLSTALADLDMVIREQDEGLSRSIDEIERLGLTVLRINPLTIHIPGRTRNDNVVFCWQEGEESLSHGHAVGEEEEPRRPLKVRVVDMPRP